MNLIFLTRYKRGAKILVNLDNMLAANRDDDKTVLAMCDDITFEVNETLEEILALYSQTK